MHCFLDIGSWKLTFFQLFINPTWNRIKLFAIPYSNFSSSMHLYIMKNDGKNYFLITLYNIFATSLIRGWKVRIEKCKPLCTIYKRFRVEDEKYLLSTINLYEVGLKFHVEFINSVILGFAQNKKKTVHSFDFFCITNTNKLH